MTGSILGSFAEWLAVRAADSRRAADAALLHADMCRGLSDRGLPLWRSTLLLEILHPVESGRQVLWMDGRVTTTSRERETSFFDDYNRSPLRIVDETGQSLRRRLDGPQEMSILETLRQQGGTDYLLVPLPFIDDVRSAALSFATRAPGGFDDAAIDRLTQATLLAAPYIERIINREIAISMLDTYLGHKSGEKVFAGRIDRTGVERLDAAILFADLRNFTGLSNLLAPEQVVALLDEWFDVVGGAVGPRGGDILKFMGDGVLAVFPTEGDRPGVCAGALDAARAIIEDGRTLSIDLDGASIPVGFGIGMHVGEVAYGNVGTRTRLDFTVIGPAVNLASRLQSLTSGLPVIGVASGAFSRALGTPLPSLGDMAVRGFDKPVAVHKVDAPAP